VPILPDRGAPRSHRAERLERGVKYFYIHSDPFLRAGLTGIRKLLGQ